MMKVLLLVSLPLVLFLTGCTPEVGSPEWCHQMDQKAKGDWTANEAADYAKNCIFRKKEQ